MKERNTIKENPKPVQLTSLIQEIEKSLSERGKRYSPELIQRYAASLLCHRFVILAGPSGTGKTSLAEEFAQCLCEQPQQQILVHAVGADWLNRVPVLGYPDPLQPQRYESTPTIEFLLRANDPEHQSKPFFLILDEMNLSMIEKYFADFLSAMERSGEIVLYSGPAREESPRKIQLPHNVFIVGTVNFDHTTHPLSPKVLDRVQIIEVTTHWELLKRMLRSDESSPVLTNKCNMEFGSQFLLASQYEPSFSTEDIESLEPLVGDLFTILNSKGYTVSYRVIKELKRFCWFYRAFNPEVNLIQGLDIQILQKILPRIEGGGNRIQSILEQLSTWCKDNHLNLSHNKIAHMLEKIIEGYTTYWN